MDLSIIIVSYNVKDKLRLNLEAISKSQTSFSWELLVVDNASIDGSADMVAEFFPHFKLIRNEENLGFARANNIAIKKAKGDFILLLNPDMQVFPETLRDSLIFAKKNPQAVVSSCSLFNAEKKLIKHVRRFPRFLDQAAIILKLPHLFPKIIKRYLCLDFDYQRSQAVDSVRGSFFMINRKSWQDISSQTEPLLDERYFLWFEEVDFCRQVHKLGGEVYYNPQAFCLDHVGQSFALLKRGRAQRYFSGSMLKYFKKWHPAWQYYLLKILWPLGKGLALFFSIFKIKKKKDEQKSSSHSD